MNIQDKLRDKLKEELCPSHEINKMCEYIHFLNSNWWVDLETGEYKERNIGELLMLCVSELAEAMEANRKMLMDDKIKHRAGFHVELADCVIRIMDMCGAFGIDLGGIIIDKLEYNLEREDHKLENRREENGKKY